MLERVDKKFALAGGKIIETDDRFAVAQKPVHEAAANEARRASNKEFFHVNGQFNHRRYDPPVFLENRRAKAHRRIAVIWGGMKERLACRAAALTKAGELFAKNPVKWLK
jgi:hypothetical protein